MTRLFLQFAAIYLVATTVLFAATSDKRSQPLEHSPTRALGLTFTCFYDAPNRPAEQPARATETRKELTDCLAPEAKYVL
jgi:hypothetical protein